MNKINLLFRQAFEYSILMVSPKKLSPLIFDFDEDFSVEKEDFRKMLVRTIEDINLMDNSKSLLVDSDNLRKLNLNVLRTFAGKSTLHNAGKNFGELFGEKIKEIDFRKYIFEINNLLENMNLGKVRIKKFNSSAIDFVILNNIFSHNLKENRATCYFMSGFFQGVLEEFTNTLWNVVETKCSSKGDPYCEFQCRNI